MDVFLFMLCAIEAVYILLMTRRHRMEKADLIEKANERAKDLIDLGYTMAIQDLDEMIENRR